MVLITKSCVRCNGVMLWSPAHSVWPGHQDVSGQHRKEDPVFHYRSSSEGKTVSAQSAKWSKGVFSKYHRLPPESKEVWGRVWGDDLLPGGGWALGGHGDGAGCTRGLFHRSNASTSARKKQHINVWFSCPPGEALELLRHRAGLHPHGLLWRPGEPSFLHPERHQQPLAEQFLQGDGENLLWVWPLIKLHTLVWVSTWFWLAEGCPL